MPKVTFIRTDGTSATHDVETGTSVMQAAVLQGEDGIVAECGGSLMCATCHVYVAEEFTNRFPSPGEDEGEMLTCTAAERRPVSRLSCQLTVTDDVDGLIVELPDVQL